MTRFGILGFGLHAVRRLMPGFALAKTCKVTALSRRDMAKAKASATEYNIPLAFDSGAELCRSPEVDAVFVTTPNALHLPDVLTAVAAGKPVLCEKPMGMNAAECGQMVEAARAAKVLLGVAQVFRFEDSTARLRERIASGQIGRPIFARSEFSYPAMHHKRVWITDPKLAGGGPIMDVGVHCVDALRYVLQDEVVRVFARALWDERSGGVEAASAMSLEFSKGTMGTVLVSMRADDGLNVERPISVNLRRESSVVESEVVSNKYAYARQVDMFAAAVRGEAAFPAPGEEGWQNQEILDAAFRSLKSGRAEDVARVNPSSTV